MNSTDPFTTPVAAPPPGITPNFVDPYSLNTVNVVVSAICITVSTLAISAKVYTKALISKNLGWEDYTILITWALYIPFVAVGFLLTKHGSGTHAWNLHISDMPHILFYGNVTQVLAAFIISLIKISIDLQLLRLFFPPGVKRTIFFTLLCIQITVNIVLYTCVAFVQIFQCTPRQKIWEPQIEGRCLSVESGAYFEAGIDIVTCIVQLVVPIWFVFRLRLSWKKKLGIAAIFGTGTLSCVASIMHLVYIRQTFSTGDGTWIVGLILIWAHAEITFGILVACLPSFPLLYQTLLGKGPSSQISSLEEVYVREREAKNWSSRERESRRDRESGVFGGIGLPSAVGKGGAHPYIRTMEGRDGSDEFPLREVESSLDGVV